MLKNYDIVIIGASAAGITAGLTARKYYPQKSIICITDVSKVPIPCGIPYVFGTIGDAMKNLIPVENMCKANNIDLVNDKVIKINREFKLVLLESNESYGYQKLVIANGSNPIIPTIEGTSLENVFMIRKDPSYLTTMMKQIDESKKIVIIGGGFIGAEMAEECRKRRLEIEITIIEMQQHCLQLVYDEEFTILAEKALIDQKIKLLTQEKVKKLVGHKAVEQVILESGKIVEADMVLLCIGCSANISLAQEAGLRIGPTRGILVDSYMRTSDTDIFACGDVCEKVSFFDQKPSNLKLASIATAEARIAGRNLFENKRKMEGVIGCFSTALGGLAFCAAGLTESQATAKGFEVVCGVGESVNRHPGLMPGAGNMKVKLIFNKKDTALIGAEIFGAISGGELINALSVCISQKITAENLVTFQAATHPALTASPIAYQLVNAAEMACVKLN
jgi:pyruvate/2-oxoglutarate dehydrogenase complex dihydrolipoamide dehydrogenase (E3) component